TRAREFAGPHAVQNCGRSVSRDPGCCLVRRTEKGDKSMTKANTIAPLILGVIGLATACMTQVAVAQPAASPNANVDTRYASLVIQPRIMLPVAEQQRLQAVAAQGSDALRRYLWRTRGIYNYHMADLVDMT